jgi:hypothetical protein
LAVGMLADTMRRINNSRPEPDRRPGPPDRWRPPRPYDFEPPRRVVYIEQSPVVATTVQTTSAATTEPVKLLSLIENPTTIIVPTAPKDVVNKAKKLLAKEIVKKLESVVESLEDSVMTEDKANSIAQKFINEGKDKKKVSDFLSAINSGDADIAGKIVTELSDDPFEANKIVKEINLNKQITEFSESIQDENFTKQDSSNLKKLIDKAKLSLKIKKNVQKAIKEFDEYLGILEILTSYKASSKETILAPTGVVTVIYCPSLQQDVAYALDSQVYIINGDEFGKDEEDISATFPKIPVYNNPISQSTQQTKQVNLINSTDRTATYHLDDNTSRTLEAGKKATFDLPSSETIRVRSQGRWKAFSVGTGNYAFNYSGGVWSIVSNQLTITLDNSANPLPFTCFINEQEHTIGPGEQISFTASNGVFDVQFARNENVNNRATYVIEENGSYKIGLDQKDNKWALFQ